MSIRSMLVLLALSPAALGAQHEGATRLLEEAVAAHGGMDALRAARHLRVTIQGQDVHRMQSRRVAPPYDTTTRAHDFMFDLDRGRLVVTQLRGYPGGFVRHTRFVTDGERGFAIDLRAREYTRERFPPAEQQLGNLFYLPQFRLLTAVADPAPERRQLLGARRLSSGTVVDAVRTSLPNGAEMILGFDPRTRHLRAVLSRSADPLLGDADVETEFIDYRTIGGVLLPTRWVTRRAGEVVADVAFTSATPGYVIPDSLLSPPSGFADATALAASVPASASVAVSRPIDGSPDAPVRELAPGVWAIRGGGSWSLLVAFDDHLLVVDAPPRSAPDVLARAAELAPGKPIRFVVPTHHHDDHFAGVRHFAATGATTVTTRGNADYFRRIVSAPATSLQPDPPPPSPAAKLETITGGRRVFTDGTRTVEIHDIGPSPHADEMLVAWLPAEGILFQGDLIDGPASGLASRGINSETTLHFAAFIRRQGWDVRTLAGTHAMIASPSILHEIVQQPILPPE